MTGLKTLTDWKNPITKLAGPVPFFIGADPGEHKGYALVDPKQLIQRKCGWLPSILAIGTDPEHVTTLANMLAKAFPARNFWALIEFQYSQRITSGEISAESIIKLAFRAGYMIRDLRAEVPRCDNCFAASPTTWKPEVLPGPNRRKDIFCEAIKRQLTETEKELFCHVPASHTEDVLDAIGLAWALWCVANKPDAGSVLPTWKVTPGHIIPRSPSRAQGANRAKKKTQPAPQGQE